MDLHDSVAVVTGSNRGLGRQFAAQLLERGAKKVYATARNPESVQIAGVTPLGLDITDPDSVARAAASCRRRHGAHQQRRHIDRHESDGRRPGPDRAGDADELLRPAPRHTRVRADPGVKRRRGDPQRPIGNIVAAPPRAGAYGAAKAAAWAMTDATRQELAPHGTHVAALLVAYMDTDMTAHIDVAKANPADVAALALDGIETDLTEILADDITRNVKQGLSAPPRRRRRLKRSSRNRRNALCDRVL